MKKRGQVKSQLPTPKSQQTPKSKLPSETGDRADDPAPRAPSHHECKTDTEIVFRRAPSHAWDLGVGPESARFAAGPQVGCRFEDPRSGSDFRCPEVGPDRESSLGVGSLEFLRT